MDLKKHIGQRVKEARTRAGLTQEQLAERLGRSVRTVSNIEGGELLTGLETLEQIALSVTRPLSYFVEGYGPALDTEAASDPTGDLAKLAQGLSKPDLALVMAIVETVLQHRR